MELIDLLLNCDCHELNFGSESYPEMDMQFCLFHGAAGDMYEALVAVQKDLDEYRGMENVIAPHTEELIAHAISRAQPKNP